MPEEDEKIIWFIDNEENQLRTYSRHLERALETWLGEDRQVVVRELKAFPHKEQYLKILEDPRTVSFLIDQVLKDKGGVDHTGIELAQYLRQIDDIMPIYILTNYPQGDEYAEGEWSVEYIINKRDIGDSEEKRKVVISRLVRRIRGFNNIRSEREARFRELLRKSLNDELTTSENHELEELEFSRSAATLATEQAEMARPEPVDEFLQQLEKIRQIVESFEKDD